MKFIDPRHDPWHPVGGEDGPIPTPSPREHALLTLEQWHAVRDTWPTGLPTGLLVPHTLDVAELAPDLPRLALLVLQFPKWTDGRAYSQARTLRRRLGWAGELRAAGDVLVDMVPLLARTGFSSARLRPDQKPEVAQAQLDAFAGHYQADVAAPPAFARDLAAELARHLQQHRQRAEASAGEGI